jgi:hypothetical protein
MTQPIEALAGGIAAGISAITVAALGVEPQPIAWVAFGASLGIVSTQPAGRARTVVVFVATVAAGALIATVAAKHYGLDNGWRNLAALGLGAFFPVIKERLAMVAPKLIDGALKRIVGRLPK